ncbi:unnamed protein product, partial [Owenia fusiformis]
FDDLILLVPDMIRTVCLLLMALGCYAEKLCVCPDRVSLITSIYIPGRSSKECQTSSDCNPIISSSIKPAGPYGCCPVKSREGKEVKYCMQLSNTVVPGTCPLKDVTDIASCKRVCSNDCECNGEGVNLIPPEGTQYKCCKSRVCGRKICRENMG